MIMETLVEMLSRLTLNDFDTVYSILKDSFLTDEIRPYRQQKALFEKNMYKIFGLRDEQNKNIKAFIAIYEFDAMIFVEHFAVNSQYRNHGLGSAILREMMNGSDKMFCLEVELPTTDIATRRINFYKRNGFYLNDYPYTQPPLAENQKSLQLKLMSSGRPLGDTEFRRIKSLIFKDVYNCESSD